MDVIKPNTHLIYLYILFTKITPIVLLNFNSKNNINRFFQISLFTSNSYFYLNYEQ